MASIECEHPDCTATVHHELAHSCLIVLQKVDKQGYSYHQCEQGQEFNFMNWQHWHCSAEHMQVNLATCIQEHYSETDLQPPKMGTTILHKVVLGSELSCKECSTALTDVAYRFCLTMATPVNLIPDDSHSELGEWCCSLSCARISALAIIASIQQE